MRLLTPTHGADSQPRAQPSPSLDASTGARAPHACAFPAHRCAGPCTNARGSFARPAATHPIFAATSTTTGAAATTCLLSAAATCPSFSTPTIAPRSSIPTSAFPGSPTPPTAQPPALAALPGAADAQPTLSQRPAACACLPRRIAAAARAIVPEPSLTSPARSSQRHRGRGLRLGSAANLVLLLGSGGGHCSGRGGRARCDVAEVGCKLPDRSVSTFSPPVPPPASNKPKHLAACLYSLANPTSMTAPRRTLCPQCWWRCLASSPSVAARAG